jgi:hypothetical protein
MSARLSIRDYAIDPSTIPGEIEDIYKSFNQRRKIELARRHGTAFDFFSDALTGAFYYLVSHSSCLIIKNRRKLIGFYLANLEFRVELLLISPQKVAYNLETVTQMKRVIFHNRRFIWEVYHGDFAGRV